MGRANGHSSKFQIARRVAAVASPTITADDGFDAVFGSRRGRPPALDTPWQRVFADYGSNFTPGDPWCEAWRESGLDLQTAAAWAISLAEKHADSLDVLHEESAFFIAEAKEADKRGLSDEDWWGWWEEEFAFTDCLDDEHNISKWLAMGYRSPKAVLESDEWRSLVGRDD